VTGPASIEQCVRELITAGLNDMDLAVALAHNLGVEFGSSQVVSVLLGNLLGLLHYFAAETGEPVQELWQRIAIGLAEQDDN
jgi:hypothetical protein